MIVLFVITIGSLALSVIIDPKKTLKALKIALNTFLKILPVFLQMLILVSIILSLISPETIQKYLGNSNRFLSEILAILFGSITMMPGFITFPLCGILLKQGITYTVIALFTTTLMMVGVATFPIEKKFLGTKVAIIRNIIGLITAIIVSVIIGLFYGELKL